MRYHLLAIILLACSLALNFKPVGNSVTISTLKSSAFNILAPLDSVLSFTFEQIDHSLLFIVHSYKAQDKLKDYERRIKLLDAENLLLMNLKNENDSLRSALNFKHSEKFSLAAANIISREEKNWGASVIVDTGSNKGVHPGLTVISSKGLIGIVVEVSKKYSKVMLVTSPQSSVGVVLAKSNIFGSASGGYGKHLNISYIPESASIEVSEPVFVSSASGIYIPGIFVGRVSKVQKSVDNIFQKVELEPVADASTTGVVYICKPY